MKCGDSGVLWRWRGVAGTGSAPMAALIAMVAVALLAAGCSTTATGAERKTTATMTAVPRASATAGRTAAPSRSPAPRPKPRPPAPAALPVGPADSGSLKQTEALPHTTDTAFKHLVHDLWLAVTTGKARYALPAFFPEQAYEQVKAIADPEYDWRYRLWYDFTLDVAAVHPLLGHGAKLLKVIVPGEYAQWVPPGACYNSDGYWHVPGARVVYEQRGAMRSFGIASLISWRGDWYLIHFGGVVRGAYGMVDDPEPGTGIPGPPGGC